METREARYTGVRTALIGYGVAAFMLLMGREPAADEPQARTLEAAYLIAGLSLQGLVVVVRALLERRIHDAALRRQALLLVELIADGVTVLLFAAATFGAIQHAVDGL